MATEFDIKEDIFLKKGPSKICSSCSHDSEVFLKDAKFKTFGCGSAIASSSLATEMIKGKELDHALQVTNKEIAYHLRLPPVKLHCSMLAEDAIKSAIEDYKNKQPV